MLILSVDSTATPASVCLYDEKIIASFCINTELTHSQTLVSMIESSLLISGHTAEDVDLFAVNNGPGSFTGVRIGVSAVKGMAYALNKPCIAVSTLESIAYNFLCENAVVCACMDARRNQFYNALFRVKDGKVIRLCDDRAISADELSSEILSYGERVIIAGDGGKLFYDSLGENGCDIILAPYNTLYQNACAVAYIASLRASNDNNFIESSALFPSYLRLSQAERELNKKRNE